VTPFQFAELLTTEAFYTQTAHYMRDLDATWQEERLQQAMAVEHAHLAAVLGRGADQAVLDCACGPGTQVIPLADLGWHVTGLDASAAVLPEARARAARAGLLRVDWRLGDMRKLGQLFPTERFAVVVSCMALDNTLSDDGLRQAVHAMHAVLQPGGRCYLRLRDFDHLLKVRPRYDVKEERVVRDGRVIRLEDWLYESEQHVINAWVFLRQDTRKAGYQWDTTVFAYRRRALRKAELDVLLHQAGFDRVSFLPQLSPWDPFEVIAERTNPA